MTLGGKQHCRMSLGLWPSLADEATKKELGGRFGGVYGRFSWGYYLFSRLLSAAGDGPFLIPRLLLLHTCVFGWGRHVFVTETSEAK